MGTLILILWKAALRLRILFYWLVSFFTHDTQLHRARFAGIQDMARLLTPLPPPTSLLLGMRAKDFVSVQPTLTRPELGNLLVVAPTRGGNGLLAVSQLLVVSL